mmetsp:Transcript_115685/g.230608  ORF Transcript_115685/g.230608 Transcript_115685/m.230608 type:complete len:292 (-) Transcript_115685:647-1522(-)
MLSQLLLCILALGLIQIGIVRFLNFVCPLLQIFHFILPECAGKVVNTFAFQLALPDLFLALALNLRLTGPLNLVKTNLLKVVGDNLLDLLSSYLEASLVADVVCTFLHLLQLLCVNDFLLIPAVLLLTFHLSAFTLFLLALSFRLSLTRFLPGTSFHGFAVLQFFAALALFLATLNLFFSLAYQLGLLFHTPNNALREQLLLKLLLLMLFLRCNTLHGLLQFVADLNQWLPHALHVNLAGCTENNRLVTVIDLDVDAVLPCGICHPLFSDTEGHDGCRMLEILNGHVSIDL